MHKIFILGMRRSGTSYALRVISRCKELEISHFEPHMYYAAAVKAGLPRIAALQSFKHAISEVEGRDSWVAKFAPNPGVEALRWKELAMFRPEAKFLFMRRDQLATWESYAKLDRDHITQPVPCEIHAYFWNRLYSEFEEFLKQWPDRGILLDLEKVKGDRRGQWAKAFKALNLTGHGHVH